MHGGRDSEWRNFCPASPTTSPPHCLTTLPPCHPSDSILCRPHSDATLPLFSGRGGRTAEITRAAHHRCCSLPQATFFPHSLPQLAHDALASHLPLCSSGRGGRTAERGRAARAPHHLPDSSSRATGGCGAAAECSLRERRRPRSLRVVPHAVSPAAVPRPQGGPIPPDARHPEQARGTGGGWRIRRYCTRAELRQSVHRLDGGTVKFDPGAGVHAGSRC